MIDASIGYPRTAVFLMRFRLDLSHFSSRSDFGFKGDFSADNVIREIDIDIRQALVSVRLYNWLDLKAGRQILTWGTGDLVFLNDLFPKDFVSFFIGREDEFLKAPSNAIKFSLYSSLANADVVWAPMFEPDRFITGERLSFFNPMEGRIVSAASMGQLVDSKLPDKKLDNSEVALRLSKYTGGYELALYGYVGLTKQPLAFDTTLNISFHSHLAVAGASIRGALFGGIANAEGAYYRSDDDPDGSDPNIPNSEIRGLVGYEQELFANFSLGLQNYLEWIQDYQNLIDNSPAPEFEGKEVRHWVTTRLTYRLLRQTLNLSLFGFITLDEGDFHLRPSLSYKWSDAVSFAAGANMMEGDDHTFFGQLKNNSNVYARLRYSF